MDMRQDIKGRLSNKQQERKTIRLLYKIERMSFYILLGVLAIVCLTVLVGLLFSWEPWSQFLLQNTLPWPGVLAIAILVVMLFPIADTFIQSKEDTWFARYGTEVLATVSGYEDTKLSRWRWLRFGQEQLVILEWLHPETEQSYHFRLRVRDQKQPHLHARVPVIIDYDDPTYYQKTDFKDESIRF